MRYLCVFFLLASSLFAEKEILGAQTLSYFDKERNLPVTVEVWYPTEETEVFKGEDIWNDVWIYPDIVRDAKPLDGSFPLIVMSHGHQGDRHDRTWFAEQMVAKGYIVASVEHFGNTWENNDPEFLLRPWQRPLDIHFALDCLLEEKDLPIDPTRIGFSGYSLGGMTGVWLAGGRLRDLKEDTFDLTSCELPRILLLKLLEKFDFEASILSYNDPRIKAFFLIAPSILGFDVETFHEISSPIHIVYSKGDLVLPPESNAIYLAHLVEHAELTALLSKANHYVFLNEASEYGKTLLPEWIYEEHPSVDRHQIHLDTAELAHNFFQKHL